MDELIKCLATGSTGNCYLVNLGSGCFILDAGIRITDIVKEVNLNNVDFAFISHEHKDHSKSMEMLRERSVPVLRGYCFKDFRKIQNLPKFEGKYSLWTFPVKHGECPNGGLIVKDNNSEEMLLYITDFTICKYDLKAFKFSRILIECNYDEESMPKELDFKLKRQINTHMGLQGTIDYLNTLDLSNCKEILLIHRSPSIGDDVMMGCRVYNEFQIKTGVCRQYGGIDYYG